MRALLACLAILSAATLAVPPTAATPVAYPECEATPPADVVLVLDRSGSMAGGGLTAVQSSTSTMLNKMRSADHSALVSYDHEAILEKSLDDDHAATNAAVQALAPRGGTGTGLGIDVGHAAFTANARAGAHHVMIVLTDGNTNSGPDAATEADEAKADGILVYAIGYGTGIDAAELQSIASDPSTTYHNPLTPAQLDAVFDEITAEIVGKQDADADAHNLFVEITEPALPGAVRVDRVHHVVAPDGGYDETGSFSFSEAGLDITGRLVRAQADTDGGRSHAAASAEAAVHDLRIDFLGSPLLHADVVVAYADAHARTGDSVAGNGGTILDLVVDAQPVSVVPPSIATMHGEIRFMDGTKTTTGDTAQAWMDAIHITLNPPTGQTIEVVVSHAYAGALCGDGSLTPPPPPTDDPILPECLLGAPVEVPVGPVNVVEVDLCTPCPSQAGGPVQPASLGSGPSAVAIPGTGAPTTPDDCVDCPLRNLDALAVDPCAPPCAQTSLTDLCTPDPCDLALASLCFEPPCGDPSDPVAVFVRDCANTAECKRLTAKPVTELSSNDVQTCLRSLLR